MSEDVGELAQKAWARLEDARKQAGIKEPTLKLASIGILMHVFEGARKRRELEARVEALEQAQREQKFCGVWQRAADYRRHNFTAWDGALWAALRDNTGSKPGSNPADWQLVVRSGETR